MPEDALREAVVNAVCHRDYFEKGARVMVEIYDDRVDIVSPGGVCKGITRENFGMVSITRNPIIASMLYRGRYIEQMGTGIMRMKNAAREAEVAEPVFDLSGFFKVTFRRGVNEADVVRNEVNVIRNGGNVVRNEANVVRNGENVVKNNNDTTEAMILELMRDNPRMTAKEIAAKIGNSLRNVQRHIHSLKSKSMIERVGSTKNGRWVVLV